MVIVRLAGGLGNQMFQYALGRRLALHLKTEHKLDIAYFSSQSLRSYRLSAYPVRENFAAKDEVMRLTGANWRRPQKWLWRQWQRAKPYYRRATFVEQRQHEYDPRILDAPRDVYLTGYWQNEKYFAPISDILRVEFVPKVPLSAESHRLADMMGANQAVGVHVRRGDYVSVEKTRERYGVCGPEYYERCSRAIGKQLTAPHFFVFSDDIDWARNNLHLGAQVTFVAHTGPDTDYEDLWLLSQCSVFILSNSSFSWWGAWLSNADSKIVYAPSEWYRSGQRDVSDFLPAAWHRL